MKRLNLKYIIFGLTFIIIVSIFPLIIDRLIIGNTVYSNISNSDWVSFLGSYIGAILGGIFTFITSFAKVPGTTRLLSNKLRGANLPLAKVPGTTRLLSKLANEIKKDPN